MRSPRQVLRTKRDHRAKWLGHGLCTLWTYNIQISSKLCICQVKSSSVCSQNKQLIGVRHCDRQFTCIILFSQNLVRQGLLMSLQMRTLRFAQVPKASMWHKSIWQGWQRALFPKIVAIEPYLRRDFSVYYKTKFDYGCGLPTDF